MKLTRIQKEKWIPLFAAGLVVVLDQCAKLLVGAYVPTNTSGVRVLGDFVRIVHVYNVGAAFSIGHQLNQVLRTLVLGIVPLIIMFLIVFSYFRTDAFCPVQRWAVSGIIGGGIGNLIDRFLRPNGVLDFIDVKFFGIFGFERWPAFNIADAVIMTCGLLLIISFIKQEKEISSQPSCNETGGVLRT
ncbi:signal peptidase II [Treponema pallidum]|nr:signal peptidase II [Treponema pallidum]AHN67619.1 signal peptidase II [Treponema pallidum subsp. pallidum str. Sea 81-4]ADD73069.1 signal peptidase II [Treponema pallidum subsp. pallidum str. Chicago]ANA42651.1 signal peptidase II [Treponema pallidum subsp. pallidum]QUJ38139.2 signal peptidase II [Treponema pallidum]QUJ39104.2 signal peptidase II [Treponema pallidum]